MVHSLGFFKTGEMRAIRPIENEEYDKYNECVECLLHFSDDHELFTILKMNYDEFERAIKKYEEEHCKNNQIDWLSKEMIYVDLNRHLLNFLSSMRTFLDHSEAKLKRFYGDTSPEIDSFTKSCSNEYDNHFSYRFLYKLRNYSQHCGLPIGIIEWNSGLVPGTQNISYSLKIFFNRDSLLKDFDWGTPLKSEIPTLSENFDVLQHVNQTMKCLSSINDDIIKNMHDLQKSADILYEFVKETSGSGGLPCIIESKSTGVEERLEVTMSWIPIHLVEAFRSK